MGLLPGASKAYLVETNNLLVGAADSDFPIILDVSAKLPVSLWDYVAAVGDFAIVDYYTKQEIPRIVNCFDLGNKKAIISFPFDVSNTTKKYVEVQVGIGLARSNASIVYTGYGFKNRWGLDEAGDPLLDACGNNNLTNAGATLDQNGLIGKAILFNGINASTYSTTACDYEHTDSFTVSAWIKRTALGPLMVIAGKVKASSPFSGWYLGLTEDDKLRMYMASTTSELIYETSTGVITDTNWHFVCGHYDGAGDFDLMVDGESVDSVKTGTVITGTIKGSYNFNLAAGESTTFLFDGMIDEVRVMENSRTVESCLTEYNNIKNQDTFFKYIGELYNDTATKWKIGTTKQIRWDITLFDMPADGTVKIELSRDGGTTWETIDATAPNSGVYAWIVTAPETTTALVKITGNSYTGSDGAVTDYSDQTDTSDNEFSILYVVPNTTTQVGQAFKNTAFKFGAFLKKAFR